MMGMEVRRNSLGLSRKDVAEACGVEPHTVFRWEKGQRNPDLALLKSLSAFLGATIDYLVADVSDSAPNLSSITTNSSLKEVQRRLSNLIRTIGELYDRCDSPEEVMTLLLDVGDDGRINHPKNEAFMDLLEALVPLAGEVLKAVKHGKEDL